MVHIPFLDEEVFQHRNIADKADALGILGAPVEPGEGDAAHGGRHRADEQGNTDLMVPGVTGKELFQGTLHEAQGQREKGQNQQGQIHDPGNAVVLIMPVIMAMAMGLPRHGCVRRRSS